MDLDRSRVGRIAFHLLRGTLGLASATFGLVVVGVAIYALYQWIVPAWQKMLTNPSPETSTIVLIVFTLMALFFLAFGVTITASGVRVVFAGTASPTGFEHRGLGATPLRSPGRLARWAQPRDVALVVQTRTPGGRVLLSSKRMYLVGAVLVGLFALFWNAVVFLALRDTPLHSGPFAVVWLLLAAPLPILVWLLLPPHRERVTSVQVPFFSGTANAAGLTPSRAAIVLRRTWPQRMLAPAVWLLVVAALAGPEWIEPPITKIASSRDLLVAIDVSQSMETRDVRDSQGRVASRLDAVKSVVDDFVVRRPGDRIGLVFFGVTPYLQAPFTLDHDVVRTLLGDAAIGMAGPMTMLGDAIGLGIRLFENSKAPSKVLILVTDGNDTGSRMPPARAAAIAHERGLTIYTIVVGDPATSGEKVDEAAMRAVSERTGGRSFLAKDRAALDAVYRTIDEIQPNEVESQSYRPHRPLFWIPLAAATALVAAFHALMLVTTLVTTR